MQGIFECSASERGQDKCLAHISKSSILQQYICQVCCSLFFQSRQVISSNYSRREQSFPSRQERSSITNHDHHRARRYCSFFFTSPTRPSRIYIYYACWARATCEYDQHGQSRRSTGRCRTSRHSSNEIKDGSQSWLARRLSQERRTYGNRRQSPPSPSPSFLPSRLSRCTIGSPRPTSVHTT